MQWADESVVPVARSQGLVVEHLAGETLIYDLERDEAHHLNPTAAAVFALCDGRTTASQMAAGLAQRLGHPVSAEAIGEALMQLAERELLTRVPAIEPGVSRREVVRKAALVGAGAAVAGPLIKSIVAPTPAMAASPGCKENGASCSSGNECCPGLICCKDIGDCRTEAQCAG
jgi:hypothetical protein